MKENNLSAVFNEFVRDSSRLFPAVKGKLLLYDVNEGGVYGREALNFSKLKGQDSDVEAFLRQKSGRGGTKTAVANKNNKPGLRYIHFDFAIKKADRRALPAEKEMEIFFTLDHELAHLAVRDPALAGESPQYRSMLRESIADAYALIRHYQRYGKDSTYQHPIVNVWSRSSTMVVTGETVHYTAPVLRALLAKKDEIDFAALTPAQTSEMARSFAVAHTPTAAQVRAFCRKLKPVRELYEEDNKSDDWLELLAHVAVNKKNTPFAFGIMKETILGYLDGRKDINGGRLHAPSGAYWENIRARLEEGGRQLERNGLLFTPA